MDTHLSFDDVLIKPEFSFIRSRKEVDPSVEFMGLGLRIPLISSNMDSVTGTKMACAVTEWGAGAALHRFWSIDENLEAFRRCLEHAGSKHKPIVSIGLGLDELHRAEALIHAGAEIVCIDVAHGASVGVVEQFTQLKEKYRNIGVIVGNFADAATIETFNYHTSRKPDAYKVGIGGGSACLTRVVTGVGMPTFSSVRDCVSTGYRIIADGGIRNSGDIAKCLAVGAAAVMVGRLLAGTEESPGRVYYRDNKFPTKPTHKKYRGSASKESYQVQGKMDSWRTPEGDSFVIPYEGPVTGVLQELEGGIRSAFSYVGASTVEDFIDKATIITVSGSTVKENGAHGRK